MLLDRDFPVVEVNPVAERLTQLGRDECRYTFGRRARVLVPVEEGLAAFFHDITQRREEVKPRK